jgi:hypothetical protein
MKNKLTKRIYSLLLALFAALACWGALAAVAPESSVTVLTIGETLRLNLKEGQTLRTQNPEVVKITEDGALRAVGCGGCRLIIEDENGPEKERLLMVLAPQDAVEAESGAHIMELTLKALKEYDTNVTFRLVNPDFPQEEEERTKRIGEYFSPLRSLSVAYLQQLKIHHVSYEKRGSQILDVTCTFEYNIGAAVSRSYQKDTDGSELGGQAAEVRRAVDKLIEELGLEKVQTKYEKALLVHDYFVANYAYQEEAKSNNEEYPDAFTPYGVLVNKTGVCQSYAQAYKLVLEAVGVETQYVTGIAGGEGDTVNHGWNRVKLDDGNWYNVDVTYDDPLPDRPGRKSHQYFCVTDRQLKKDHSWQEDGIRCTSTTYSYANICKRLKERDAA